MGFIRKWWNFSLDKISTDSLHLNLNILLSKIVNINNSVKYWEYINQVRLYLIKSSRGRSLAIGKPSHGQRTWSNRKSARSVKTIFRKFILNLKTLRRQQFEIFSKKSYQEKMKILKSRKRRKNRLNITRLNRSFKATYHMWFIF